MTTFLSPRDLATAIGVSESSIKRWVDDDLIQASKTAGGHRRIAVSEAVRFIRDTGTILAKPEMLGLAGISAAPAASEAAAALFEFLRAGDRDEAVSLVLSLYLAGQSIAEIVDGPLAHAMAEIGTLWKHQEAGIFQEHRATDIAMHALFRLRQVLPIPMESPRAVGCAPSGDPYILPSLAVATMLQAEGVSAVNLGPDTPLGSLALAAEDLSANVVWLSVSAVQNMKSVERELSAILPRLRALGAPLVIGGANAKRLSIPTDSQIALGSSMLELRALLRGLQLASTR